MVLRNGQSGPAAMIAGMPAGRQAREKISLERCYSGDV